MCVSSPSPATPNMSGSSVDKWVYYDVIMMSWISVSHVTSSHTVVHSSVHVGLSLG